MIKKVIRGLLTLAGMIIGQQIIYNALRYIPIEETTNFEMTTSFTIVAYILGAVIGGIILFLLSPRIINKGWQSTFSVERTLEKHRSMRSYLAPLLDYWLSTASLVSIPINNIPIPWLGNILSFILYIVLGYLA